MTDLIKTLCSLDATSGDEKAVRDFITTQIDGFCDWRIDNLGNIIAFKKGENGGACNRPRIYGRIYKRNDVLKIKDRDRLCILSGEITNTTKGSSLVVFFISIC